MMVNLSISVDSSRLAVEVAALAIAAEESAAVRQRVAELVDAGVKLSEQCFCPERSVLTLRLAEPFAALLRVGTAGVVAGQPT